MCEVFCCLLGFFGISDLARGEIGSASLSTVRVRRTKRPFEKEKERVAALSTLAAIDHWIGSDVRYRGWVLWEMKSSFKEQRERLGHT